MSCGYATNASSSSMVRTKAVFLAKTIEKNDNMISFTYHFKVPWERPRLEDAQKLPRRLEKVYKHGRHRTLQSSASSASLQTRFFDPDFDYLDPVWMEHCDEILRRSEHLNDRLREHYGIEPEEDVEDNDLRPRFLRTSDTSGSDTAGSGRRLLRIPYTPFPGKTNRATRSAARMIIKSLANNHLSDEQKYRVTSTISSIAGHRPAFNPIRRVRSEPYSTHASSVACTTDLNAARACSSSSCLSSNFISQAHSSMGNRTWSSDSSIHRCARSSSAHSRLTPHQRNSPTLSDVVRFRSRIGILSDFLRNPRHRPPKPAARPDSDASTQHNEESPSSDSE